MEKVNKRLLGVEDVNWDETGKGEIEKFLSSDGSIKILRKINESHIPLSESLRELFPGANYLDKALTKLKEMCASGSSTGSGNNSPGNTGGIPDNGMSKDTTVVIYSYMSVGEIQVLIDSQTKNLGTKTLTFLFPENSYQTVNQSILFEGFYNGTIIVDGNGTTVNDTGNIGSLFSFDLCICSVVFKNFFLNVNYSSYGIESKISLGVFVENCTLTGNEKKFFVNTVLSDAVFDSQCVISGGGQKITGYVYNWVKENYLPIKGGAIAGDLSVSGNLNVLKSLSVAGKNVVFSVNGVSPDSNNNVTVKVSDISGLQSSLDGKAPKEHSHNYLSKTGGSIEGSITIKGSITLGTTASMVKEDASGAMCLSGGNTYSNGAVLWLVGNDATAEAFPAGNFALRARNSSGSYSDLIGTYSSLKWKNKTIALSVDGVYANTSGNIVINAFSKNGGALTGPTIKRDVDDSYIRILGGTGEDSTDGQIVLYGKDSTIPGAFELRAATGTTYFSLVGWKNGSLTWNDINIVRSVDGKKANADGDVILNAFSKAGGVIEGSVTIKHSLALGTTASIVKEYANGTMCLSGGNTYSNGAVLWLVGNDATAEAFPAGNFALRARNSSGSYSDLIGSVDSLKWKGRDITVGFPNYAAGVSAANVASYTAPSDGWLFVWNVVDHDSSGNEMVYIDNFLVGIFTLETAHVNSFWFPIKKGSVAKVLKNEVSHKVTYLFYPN